MKRVRNAIITVQVAVVRLFRRFLITALSAD